MLHCKPTFCCQRFSVCALVSTVHLTFLCRFVFGQIAVDINHLYCYKLSWFVEEKLPDTNEQNFLEVFEECDVIECPNLREEMQNDSELELILRR